MSGEEGEREELPDPYHHLANSNHLRQYFFPSEPIPRLSIDDPLASQLISEEVSALGGVYRCVGGVETGVEGA